MKLMTHPGVGPVTALAMVLTIGPAKRFASPRQVASYFGLIPSEHSSGGRQQLGRISKQGNAFLRFLLVEAGQSAARYDAELGRFYRRLSARKHRALAKVAVARKLAIEVVPDVARGLELRATIQGSGAGGPESFRGRRLGSTCCVGSLPP
jgi:transposase